MLTGGCTLPELIALRARSHPDRVFIQDVGGGAYTYAQLNEAARRWGAAFRHFGIGPQDRVATFLAKPLDEVTCWLGLSWSGAVDVPINTAYRGYLLSYVLDLTQPTVIVISACYVDRIEEIANALPQVRAIIVLDQEKGATWTLPIKMISAEKFLSGAPDLELHAPALRDVTAILFTSGSTGPSKGVLIPWGLIHQMGENVCPAPGIGEADIFYHCLPLFHASGRAILTGMAVANGQVVIRQKFSASQFWSDIAQHRCTTTFLLGAMANFVEKAADANPIASSSPLRNVMMVPLVANIEAFKRRLGVRVHTWYGSTEVGVAVAVQDWTLIDFKSCGRVVAGRECRIVDADDNAVPSNTIGELVVRSSEPWTINRGYWKMPNETVNAWENLWIHTGDAMYRDEQGNFYFVDRFKDVIRRRGENISSFEVEAAINEHPDVLESAAFAVPSEWSEDEIMVVIVLKDGHKLTEQQLIDSLAPRLPHFMIPRFVEFRPALPKTETEKVRKAALREIGITGDTWDSQKRPASLRGAGASAKRKTSAE